jgi:hypothetical protein
MKRRNDSAPKSDLSNIEGALAALNAEDLRDLIRTVIPRLDDKEFSWFANAIIEQASRGRTGWQPSGPTDEGVAEVLAFAEAAKRTGYADPSEVDDYLREGIIGRKKQKAFKRFLEHPDPRIRRYAEELATRDVEARSRLRNLEDEDYYRQEDDTV